jgi:heat shock protein HslJ
MVTTLSGRRVSGHRVTGHRVTGHRVTGHRVTGHRPGVSALSHAGSGQPRRPLGWIVVLVAAVAIAGGCAGGTKVTPGDGILPSSGEFVSAPSSSFDLVAGTQVRLGLSGGNLSASAGCNTLGARYRIDQGTLEIDDLMATAMGCAEELMDQDDRLAEMLSGRPLVTASPDGFTLTAGEGMTLVMVDRSVSEPDRSLEGTVWVLDSVVSGNTASGSAGFDSVELTLTDGVMTVTTACSSGFARYTMNDDGTLTFDPLALTATVDPGDPGDPGCSGSGVAEAETALTQVTSGTVIASVAGSQLTLEGNGMALVLTGR